MTKNLLFMALVLVTFQINAQHLSKHIMQRPLQKNVMLSAPLNPGDQGAQVLAKDYDNSIYSLAYGSSATERYVINPSFSANLASEVQGPGDVEFLSGAYMKNIGNLTLTGVKVNTVINYYPLTGGAATKIFDKTSTDKVDLEKDSIVGLTVEPFDFKDGKGAGRYSFTYTVGQDSADQAKGDNTYTSNMYMLSKILSKGRINPSNKALQITQYWGGGTAYRETLMPFSTKHAKGLTIDSLFAGIASNEGVAEMYVEGRIYKWEDVNNDQDVTTDEISLVALGAFEVPAGTAGNFINVRIGLENIVGSSPKFEIEDNVLYFASLMYPGGAKSIFNAYDMVPSARMLVSIKDAAGNLGFEDYPYLSSRTQDAATGNPDFSSVSLFYVDLNSDGTAQDEEVFYFPAAMALEFGGAVATKDVTNKNDIRISINPSPAREQATVKVALDHITSASLEVYNAAGKLMSSEKISDAQAEFTKVYPVQNWSAGTYIVKVNTDKGSMKKTFSVIK